VSFDAGAARGSLPAELRDLPIEVFDVTISTNALARDAASGGARHGTVFVADAQTAGLGRGGKPWFSPPGVGIWMSVVLTPELPVARLGLLPLAVGAGAARALEASSGKRIGLKWPNDLLIGAKKVGGILLESGVRADRLVWAVAGIGINVATDPRAFPPDLRGTATSLEAEGAPRLARELLFARVLAEVLRMVRGLEEGPAEVHAEFRARDALAGRTVRIDQDGARLVGVAEGIAEGGALRVRSGEDVALVHHGTILSFEP